MVIALLTDFTAQHFAFPSGVQAGKGIHQEVPHLLGYESPLSQSLDRKLRRLFSPHHPTLPFQATPYLVTTLSREKNS